MFSNGPPTWLLFCVLSLDVAAAVWIFWPRICQIRRRMAARQLKKISERFGLVWWPLFGTPSYKMRKDACFMTDGRITARTENRLWAYVSTSGASWVVCGDTLYTDFDVDRDYLVSELEQVQHLLHSTCIYGAV